MFFMFTAAFRRQRETNMFWYGYEFKGKLEGKPQVLGLPSLYSHCFQASYCSRQPVFEVYPLVAFNYGLSGRAGNIVQFMFCFVFHHWLLPKGMFEIQKDTNLHQG